MGLALIGTVAARVREQVERSGSPATPLEDRLGGVETSVVVEQAIADGSVRREGDRLVHVSTGRSFRTEELFIAFLEGWQGVQTTPGADRGVLRWAEDERVWIHEPSGERFRTDLAAQTFESAWNAGVGSRP